MGRVALSDAVKKVQKRRLLNQHLQQAVQLYQDEQQKPTGSKRLSLAAVASRFSGVTVSTLARHVKPGHVSMSAFNATKQKIKPSEERVLLDAALEASDLGLPWNRDELTYEADAILKAREGEGFVPVGKYWAQGFLDRHRDELQMSWSRPLDSQRARALNPTVIRHFYHELVRKRVVEAGILPENMYGMDESGFQPSNKGRQRVIARRGTKNAYKQGGADRENITVLVTICADGTALVPTVVFKGQKLRNQWKQNNVADCSYSCSKKGWTDQEIAVDWLKNTFDPQTAAKACGRERLLLVDGHSSHTSTAFLAEAKARNITVLAYPPHCTHALQGLDVVCFAKLKKMWVDECAAFEQRMTRKVTKADFLLVFGTAFLKAFDPATVKAAFSATGIHPFNPDAISASQMKPSEVFSTHATFPLPQTSPVRAVMAAFHHQRPTSFDTALETHTAGDVTPSRRPRLGSHLPSEASMDSPSPTPSPVASTSAIPFPTVETSAEVTAQVPGPSDPPHTPHRPAIRRRRSPSSPPASRVLDPALDPSLFTPRKRMRAVSSALAGTTTGSFLVSRDPITSAQRIAPPVIELAIPTATPDYSLMKLDPTKMNHADLVRSFRDLQANYGLSGRRDVAQQSIMEAQGAQLVVQHLHLDKLNHQLHERETKKHDDRGHVLFPEGKGRVLTDDIVIEAERAAEQERERKKHAKHASKEARAAKKRERAHAEVEWEGIKRRHELAVAAWERDCEQLTTSGMRKKDLPKRPVRPLKPKAGQPARERAPRRRRAATPASDASKSAGSSSSDSGSGSDGELGSM